MRVLLLVLFSLFSFVLLTGMGNLGGPPEGGIPHPKEDIQARLVDRSGTATELSKFSMDGNTYLEGKRGEGSLAISLGNIRGIEFGQMNGEQVAAKVQLKTGKSVNMQVKSQATFYGDTGYGAFRINARDVARIEVR